VSEITSSGIVVPDGFGAATEGRGPLGETAEQHGFPRGAPHGEWTDSINGTGMVVNETGLPDDLVMGATKDYFVENASLAWGQQTNFQLYNQQQGSMLARSDYRTPTTVQGEIELARNLAEFDDDVATVLREMIALAFGEGMEHSHTDERSLAIFNEVAKKANLDHALKEMYREYLIASQFTTAMLFTRQEIEFTPRGASSSAETNITAPVIGVFHSEHVRVLGNDLFGTGILAYDPPQDKLRSWLDEYFSPRTTPARKAEMGRQDRATANLFTGVVEPSEIEQSSYSGSNVWGATQRWYLLNPRLAFRTAMPKGAWKYPKPLLTANFGLLEAKRLLNIMDYALLQGGANFVVVAKKGSDKLPAQAEEVQNLVNVVRTASKTGMIVGDHRLSFEIITPKLDELLNSEKRRLLGRKIAMRMMGVAERAEESASNGEQSDTEVVSRVVMADRRDIQRHIENNIYPEVVKRNRSVLPKGPASIWFPKIILQGLNYFTELVLKLRDRGDIARSTAVAAAGFDWDAEVAKRKQEKASGADDIMVPASVPHSSPEAGPQDNNEGRPSGSKDGSKPDPAAPKVTVTKTRGETIKAWWDADLQDIIRIGETTYSILEEYAATKDDNENFRVSGLEREAIETAEIMQRGGKAVVPVNQGVEVSGQLRVVRLREGLRMIVGYTKAEGAIVAVALSFSEPEFEPADVERRVARWGYGVPALPAAPLPEETAVAPSAAPGVSLVVGDGARVLIRDADGNITGSRPADDDPE
jgi:hypothetical protein